MASLRPWVAAATALGLLAVAPSAHSKEVQDRPTSWDLLSRDIRVEGSADWASWWAVNRAAVLKPSYRAAAGQDGAPPPPDAAARARAHVVLLRELKAKDRIVSSEAALALGRAGDPADIGVLARIVADGKVTDGPRTHTLAAIGLGLLPAGDAAQAAEARRGLLDGVGDGRGEEDRYRFLRTGCAYACALRRDAAVVPSLLDLRKDARTGRDMRLTLDGEVLGAMCFSIASLAGEAALPEIKEQLAGRKSPNSGNKDNSWSACHALARIPGEESRRLLRTAARDDRETLRRAALGALGTIGDAKDDDTAAVLRAAMSGDKDADCRQAAAISLGRIAHPSSAGALLKSYFTRITSRDKRDADVLADRSAVVLALGLCARAKPDPEIRSALLRGVNESLVQDEQAALALACGLAGIQEARARIADLADEGKGGALAPTAAFALGLVGAGPEELKVLREAVAQSVFADIRGAAARALGMLRDKSVVEQLRAIVKSKKTRDVDRCTAAVCLGVVGSDADIDVLIEAIDASGAEGQVRGCLVHALGRLLDRTENAALGRVAADSIWFPSAADGVPDAILDVQHLAD
jgi:HEAT repeat protein